MADSYHAFHVISTRQFSSDELNPLYDIGLDWHRSGRHVSSNGSYHYHYLFFGDVRYSIAYVIPFFAQLSELVYFGAVQDEENIVNYIMHS